MGMYTELKLDFRLRSDTPPDVLYILDMMSRNEVDTWEELEGKTPDHDLFETERWQIMLTCESSYHDVESNKGLESQDKGMWRFRTHSSFKNYCGEIDRFVRWIKPWVVRKGKGVIGYYQHEQQRVRTNLYVRKGE